MTENRFTFIRGKNGKSIGIFDNKYERIISEWGPIVRLLNKLESENNALKQRISDQDMMIYARDRIIEDIEKDL